MCENSIADARQTQALQTLGAKQKLGVFIMICHTFNPRSSSPSLSMHNDQAFISFNKHTDFFFQRKGKKKKKDPNFCPFTFLEEG